MRLFGKNGSLVKTGLENRVISMSVEQLSRTSRAVGVAGGSRKYAGILGALRGLDQYYGDRPFLASSWCRSNSL
jgi:DNA-binding transcriptional regulator LsrR (DeoR family)